MKIRGEDAFINFMMSQPFYEGEKMKKLSEYYKELIEQLLEAKNEAIKNGIKANTIVINSKSNLAKILPHNTGNGLFPPMIAGLEVKFTADIPDEYSFFIFETPQTEAEKVKAELKEIKEKLESLLEEK